MKEHEKPKIFLSYAHEDIGMAKRIYQDLKRYGLDVWIDCESLLPGQKRSYLPPMSTKCLNYMVIMIVIEIRWERGLNISMSLKRLMLILL